MSTPEQKEEERHDAAEQGRPGEQGAVGRTEQGSLRIGQPHDQGNVGHKRQKGAEQPSVLRRSHGMGLQRLLVASALVVPKHPDGVPLRHVDREKGQDEGRRDHEIPVDQGVDRYVRRDAGDPLDGGPGDARQLPLGGLLYEP